MTQHATVSMPLSELNELTAKIAMAEAETAKVRAELVAARLGSPDGRVANVTAFARDCLTIARFAVAHCPPEMIVGWPYDVLHRVADGLAILPDFSIMDRDMGIDLHGFARECEEYERKRRGPLPVARVVESECDTAAYGTTTFRGEGLISDTLAVMIALSAPHGGGGHHGGGHGHGGGTRRGRWSGGRWWDATAYTCPPVYDPVVGSDGVVYGNPCLAQMAGVAVVRGVAGLGCPGCILGETTPNAWGAGISAGAIAIGVVGFIAAILIGRAALKHARS